MRFAVVAVAGLLVAACGGGSKVLTPSEVAQQLGCGQPVEQETEELFVRSLYDCGATDLYFFNDNQARDNWRDFGEKMGAVVLEQGDRWLQVKD
jgi:hypothetical protein